MGDDCSSSDEDFGSICTSARMIVTSVELAVYSRHRTVPRSYEKQGAHPTPKA
jgi:hypothetical protein